ncbi:MAG: hypothetical protein JXA36_04915 [Coriobacteriia bacterium]|nr:hypothetical protein [Coriobacteriia bacterium]
MIAGTHVYQSDWILRQIELMGDVLRRLVDALREHRPDDAIALSREAVEELLDTDPALIDALTGEGLLTLLSAGGALDTYRSHMLAEILLARAEALDMSDRGAEAADARTRARVLLEAALPLSDGSDVERMRELLGWLEG